jgi:hypothetical protein
LRDSYCLFSALEIADFLEGAHGTAQRYFAFGPFLEVIVFVGFYAWGMSWSSRRQIIG